METTLTAEVGLDRLAAKLSSIARLTEGSREALGRLPMTVKSVDADQDIVREGERPYVCCLLLDGFACRYKLLEDGRRQIFSYHVAGDIPDLQSLHLHRMDHSLGTLTPVAAGFIPHEAIRAVAQAHPDLAVAFWRDTLVDAAIFREWMIGMGRRTARQSVAHLLCEVVRRLIAVGLSDGRTATLPITQEEIGDSLGLSTVHVNRVLQDLREQELIAWRGTHLEIRNWANLASAGEFDAAYLHLTNDGNDP